MSSGSASLSRSARQGSGVAVSIVVAEFVVQQLPCRTLHVPTFGTLFAHSYAPFVSAVFVASFPVLNVAFG